MNTNSHEKGSTKVHKKRGRDAKEVGMKMSHEEREA